MGKAINRTMPSFRALEINFHQKVAVKLPVGRAAKLILLLFSVLGFGGLGWLGLSANHEWGVTYSQLTSLNSQVEALAAANITLNAKKDSSTLLLSLPAIIRSERIEATALLDKLAPLIPYAANIESIGYGDDGSTILVTGLFASTEAVISFEQAIRASTDFKLLAMNGLSKVSSDSKAAEKPAGLEDNSLAALQVTFELQYLGAANKVKSPNKGGA